MKKQYFWAIITAICLCFGLVACKDITPQAEIIQDEIIISKDVADSPENQQEEQNKSSEIDVDLTQLSSIMVYAEVYNMMVSPEKYIGKTVRMEGVFAIYQAVDETGAAVPNTVCLACVITDAAACCSQGIEFVPKDGYSYPDNYPEPGSEITITGEFATYEKNGYKYIHLVEAILET